MNLSFVQFQKLYFMSNLQQSIKVDYYGILGVTRQSTLPQICTKYRQIALANHPALHHQNPNAAYQRFAQAAEAFDVLFDSQKKKIYDEYGQRQLKQGVLRDGNMIGKYKFTTDPEEIFQKFFGSKNVFEHLLDVGQGKGDSHPIFKAQYPSLNDQYKVPNLIVPVHCTLTELFNGCTKEISYDKKVLTKDGKNSQFVKETKTITIVPGDGPKTPLVFTEQGNCEPGYRQSMLIFNIVEVNEKGFRRQADNLIYTAKISLMDALDSKSITVKQLNGQLINLHFDEIIAPQTRRVLGDRGMPVRGKPGVRGDLVVKFDIQFPEQLELAKKQRIVQLLRQA